MGYYIDQGKLENRLSAQVTRKIYDDDNDGNADTGPLTQVIDDAERWFESVAIGVYPDLDALRANAGEIASSMVLDCAEALAAKRFPRAVGREWMPLIDWCDKQLMRLRRGEIKLPIEGSPNPPANTGGQVSDSHGNVISGTDCPDYFAMGGTGIF